MSQAAARRPQSSKKSGGMLPAGARPAGCSSSWISVGWSRSVAAISHAWVAGRLIFGKNAIEIPQILRHCGVLRRRRTRTATSAVTDNKQGMARKPWCTQIELQATVNNRFIAFLIFHDCTPARGAGPANLSLFGH
jgi:hypothetical protein